MIDKKTSHGAPDPTQLGGNQSREIAPHKAKATDAQEKGRRQVAEELQQKEDAPLKKG